MIQEFVKVFGWAVLVVVSLFVLTGLILVNIMGFMLIVNWWVGG